MGTHSERTGLSVRETGGFCHRRATPPLRRWPTARAASRRGVRHALAPGGPGLPRVIADVRWAALVPRRVLAYNLLISLTGTAGRTSRPGLSPLRMASKGPEGETHPRGEMPRPRRGGMARVWRADSPRRRSPQGQPRRGRWRPCTPRTPTVAGARRRAAPCSEAPHPGRRRTAGTAWPSRLGAEQAPASEARKEIAICPDPRRYAPGRRSRAPGFIKTACRSGGPRW
jgi:hypothetical protein